MADDGTESCWNIDSLHDFLVELITGNKEAVFQRIDDNKEAVNRRIDDLIVLLDERQRANHLAGQTALTTAQDAVYAALAATREAISKSESATDARFASVNEFRKQLSDQAVTFVTRAESNAKFDAATHDRERLTAQLTDLELRVTSRLDSISGQAAGQAESAAAARANTTRFTSIIITIVAVVSLAVTIIVATRPH